MFTPVNFPIMENIRNAMAISSIPAIAVVRVCWAEAVVFGLPPDVKNLNPPTSSMTKKAISARGKIIFKILANITSMHLSVGVSFTMQLFQSRFGIGDLLCG
jgi:hypothetical protein